LHRRRGSGPLCHTESERNDGGARELPRQRRVGYESWPVVRTIDKGRRATASMEVVVTASVQRAVKEPAMKPRLDADRRS
jgi:hypothetical protein